MYSNRKSAAALGHGVGAAQPAIDRAGNRSYESLSMLKVLIIEDNDDNREILKQQLKHLSYEVAEAANGAEGLKQAEEEKPDIIIIDIMMPEMDGREVARQLRANPSTKRIPILAATVLFHSEDLQSCLQAGCDDVLTKPFTMRQLREKLNALSHLVRKP